MGYSRKPRAYRTERECVAKSKMIKEAVERETAVTPARSN